MSPRLARFLATARRRGYEPHVSPKEANLTHAFFERYADLPLLERQARSMAYALAHEPLVFDPDETIPGQIWQACRGAGDPFIAGAADERWREWSVAGVAPQWVAERMPECTAFEREGGATPGHVGWDWSLVLDLGLLGLRERFERAAREADDAEARAFHRAVTIVLDGAIEFARRVAEGAPPELRERCEHVPLHPARDFREAVQSFWIQHLAVMFENPHGGNGPGLMDRILWPWLERDLSRGAITLDEARELIAELFIKLDERIARHDGWVEAICVGGRTSDGGGAETPLSHILVEAIMSLKQTHPSVYMRLRDDAPDDFLALAADYLRDGGGRAQIHGDDRIIESLVASGIAHADACEWMAGGCMEESPQGRSGDFVFTYVHNLAATFEAVLHGGAPLLLGERIAPVEHDLTGYACFEDLFEAFRGESERVLRLMLRRVDTWVEAYARYRPALLLSSMVHDCLERGKPVSAGGARYQDYSGSAVGIPNVADSLLAIDHAVYREGFVEPATLLSALRANFEGHEPLRRRLLRLPRFGQDDPEADRMAQRVLECYLRPCEQHVTAFGGRVRPIVLGFVWVAGMGATTGATPDGRRAGEPLAHGLSPQCGSADRGLSAALRSVTRLDLSRLSGGAATMFDLDPAWARDDVVAATLRTFIALGGQIFQGNVLDTAQLEEALAEPERHGDLMVRVGGYSAKFVTLSPTTQQEILNRRRFGS